MPENDTNAPTSGVQPAEGRDDLGLPGADRTVPSENPEGPIGIEQPIRDVGQPDAQTQRDDQVGVGMPTRASDDDLLPNVEAPEAEA